MKEIVIDVLSAYSWENFTSCPDLDNPGIYIWSIPYDNSQLVFYIGMTKNLKNRIHQHLESYNNGLYQVFEHDLFSKGIRKHIWMGRWRYDAALRNNDIDKDTFDAGIKEYESNQEFHKEKRALFLNTMNLYFFPVDKTERILKRIETGIALNICYKGGIGIDFQEPVSVGAYFRELRREFESPAKLNIKNNIFHNLDSEILI